MIQRRQSLYLFIASLIAALLLILNLTYFETKGLLENQETASMEIGYFTTQVLDQEEPPLNNSYLIGALAAYAGLAFIAIFMFKNRKRQSLTVTLGFAFLILALVMMYEYSFGADYFIETKSKDLAWPALIPVSLLVFHFLALQGIKQDEALVKSLDRIR